MKKVLFIQHGFGYGGATKSLLLMQKVLHEKFKIYTITLKVSNKTRAIIQDFEKYSEISEYDFPSIYSYSADTISTKGFQKNKDYYPYQIIEFINKNKIDIIHINSSLFSHFLKHLKNKTKAKIVVHVREMLPNKNTEISQFIINNHIKYADAIIAISANEIQYYPKSKKITVIPNPHEFNITDSFCKNKNSDKIYVGMCADFLEYKGQLDFLEIASIINEKNGCKNKIKFRIIGYPRHSKSIKEIVKSVMNYGYKAKFDRKVKKLKLKNLEIIQFTLDIYKELDDIDIYIRPDYTGHPWGRDIIEAMAMKKPVIATGSSQFFIENGKTGYLVTAKKPKEMAEKVLKLIEDKNKRKEFGEKAYVKIKNMCDIETYYTKVLKVYHTLI